MFECRNKEVPVQIRQNTEPQSTDYRKKPRICFKYQEHNPGSPCADTGRIGAPRRSTHGKPWHAGRGSALLQLAGSQTLTALAFVSREGKKGKLGLNITRQPPAETLAEKPSGKRRLLNQHCPPCAVTPHTEDAFNSRVLKLNKENMLEYIKTAMFTGLY